MSVATEEKDMEDLMAKWDKENNVEDASESEEDADADDEHCMGYDDMLEKYRRDVNPTNNSFDHVVLGTNDLDKAIDDFEAMTGVRPLMVVSHNGLGTKSARVAFEQCAFIEIIAPDPKQPSTPQAEKLAKLPEGKLVPVHYAVRNNKGADLKKGAWADMGFECDQVTMIAKDRGMPWKWDMFFLEGHDDNGLIPIFVNWGEAHHAAGRLPIVGSLDKVVVSSSNDKLPELLSGVDDVNVESGTDSFEITFTSSKGTHTYSAVEPMGIAFPK